MAGPLQEGARVTLQEGSAEWFRAQSSKDVNVKKTIGKLVDEGATIVLGDKVEAARRFFSPGLRSERGTMRDVLVYKIAPFVRLVTSTVGFGVGEQFSYLSALIYMNETKLDASLYADLKERVDKYGAEHFPMEEEREILRQLAYPLRLDSKRRHYVVEKLQPKFGEREGQVTNLNNLRDAWDDLARLTVEKP